MSDQQNNKPAASIFLFAYFICLSFCLTGLELGNELIRYGSKVLLMPLLASYYYLKAKPLTKGNSIPLLAILFSWVGDVLLLFEEQGPLFFMGGLVFFLLAHIAFIIVFTRLIRQRGIQIKAFLFLPVLIYYGLLIYLLFPHLGSLKLPVIIYGLVISTMLALALQIGRMGRAGITIAIGAVLFVCSDSVLAINKFYQSMDWAGLFIMATYGVAQFMIIQGLLEMAELRSARINYQ